MNLQEYLDSRNITKYHLSQISSVPKTTVIDICSGKSSLQKCSALTIQKLAKALGCTMEYIMSLNTISMEYDDETEQEISAEQAWYLREKYLRMKRGD